MIFDFIQRLGLIKGRIRALTTGIECIHPGSRGPHVVADLDAVVVVPQDLIDRTPKIAEKPDPVNPNQEENDESRQQAQSELQTQHHSPETTKFETTDCTDDTD